MIGTNDIVFDRQRIMKVQGANLAEIQNKMKAGNIEGIGVNAEVQFRPGSVVTATSANFPSETYYGTVNPTANMANMGRIGIPFGGGR